MNCNKILHWSYRDFRSFPTSILDYRDSVEEIYLKENFIDSIPLWLLEINNLTFIHLAGNELKFIPEEIYLLENLEFFSVSENQIQKLPKSICKLKKLISLDISINQIDEIPKEIGELTALENLDVSKNLLKNIPNELGKCKNLIDVAFNDNNMIKEIPSIIFALSKLRNVQVDRCGLVHLPYVKCVTLKYFRMSENYLLTHIPYYYENYISDNYCYQNSFHLREPLTEENAIQISTSEENRIITLPKQILKVQSNSLRNPLSLFERSLSAVHESYGYEIDKNLLPPFLTRILKFGPVARCGGAFCNIYLFHKCYLLLLRRNRRNDYMIISHLFCSKDCLDEWFEQKSFAYRIIKWKFIN